jgi:ribosome biogenesis GTPase
MASSDYPAVGDRDLLAPGPGTPAVITAVLPRRSAFVRSAADASRRTAGNLVDEQVLAANVDVAFLVAGLDGDFNLRRLERYLAVAWSSGVRPVIVLNKADVAIDLDDRLLSVASIAPAVPVVVLSALTGDHLADLGPYLGAGIVAVVLGSSGVGKSTMVNALLGEDRQATAAVRIDDSRGRHTTTHRELFALPGGAFLIDTPGIRALEVAGADEGVDLAFDDVAELAAACRFSDCRHGGEPGCAVRTAIDEGRLSRDRLDRHRKLERELAHAERKGDARARAAEAKRWKVLHRSVARHMTMKYGEEG